MTPLYAVLSPDRIDVGPSDLRPVPSGACVDDLLPADTAHRGRYVCALVQAGQERGVYVQREHWKALPADGQVLLFHRPVLGGGGQGSDAGRIVVALAAAAIAQNYGPAYALLFSVAANGLLSLQNVTQVAPSSPTYSYQGPGNTARIDQPIPELFGHGNPYPDLASQPYYSYDESGDQYYHAVMLVSEGELEILRVSIDDTPTSHFAGVEIARCGPGQSTRSTPGEGYETLAEQTLCDPSIVTAAEVVAMEMKSGVVVGPFIPIKPELQVSKVIIDVVLIRGLADGYSISWRVDMRPVDDLDTPVGPWENLGMETIATASSSPIRRTYEYEISDAVRPEIRVMRTDTRVNEDIAHDIAWAALRVQLSEPGIDYEGATYVAVKIKATGQLSPNTQNRFRVMANRLLPTLASSDGWGDPVITRNPAWALGYVMRGLGLDTDAIDTDQLEALAAVWDERQDRFDMLFDQASSAWEAMSIIAKVGRALPIQRGGAITIWRDQQESAPVAAFTMRDITAGSFQLQFSLPESDPIDAIDLEYFDRRKWDWVTVTAQYSEGTIYAYRGAIERAALSLDPPAGPARVRVPGIIGENQAKRTAVYHLADIVYRPNRANFSTELQGLLPAYGSLVSIQHDVGDFGQGGDVRAWDSGTLTLETSEPLTWDGPTHYVRLVRPDGTVTDRIEVTEGATDHEMVLDEMPDFTIESGASGDRERTRYVFGPADNMEGLAKVRRISPNGQYEVGVELVLEDDRVHTADNEWLPSSSDEIQDPISDGGSGDGGGFDYLVFLEDHALAHGAPGGTADVEVRLSLLNDGRLGITYYRDAVIFSQAFELDEWLIPSGVSSSIAGLYEVFANVTAEAEAESDAGEWRGDSFDTWLSLGTSRYWARACVQATNGSATGTVRIRIRDAETETVLADESMTFSATTGDPP